MWAKLKNLSAIFLVVLLTLSSPLHAKKKPIEASIAIASIVDYIADDDLWYDGTVEYIHQQARKHFTDTSPFALSSETPLLMIVYLGNDTGESLNFEDIGLYTRTRSTKQAVQILILDGAGNKLANVSTTTRKTKKAISKAFSNLRKKKAQKKLEAGLERVTPTNWLLKYDTDPSSFRPFNVIIARYLANRLLFTEGHNIDDKKTRFYNEPLHIAHGLLAVREPELLKAFVTNTDLRPNVRAAARGVPIEKLRLEAVLRAHIKAMKEAGVSDAEIARVRPEHIEGIEKQYPEPKQSPLHPREVIDLNMGFIKLPGIPIWENETLLTRAMKTGQSNETIEFIRNLDWYKNTSLKYEPNLDGETFLTLAVKNNRLDLIKNFNINGSDSTRLTSAHYVLWANDSETYAALKNLGARPNMDFTHYGANLPWLEYLAANQKWETINFLARNEQESVRHKASEMLTLLVGGIGNNVYKEIAANLSSKASSSELTPPARIVAKYVADGWPQRSEGEFIKDLRHAAGTSSILANMQYSFMTLGQLAQADQPETRHSNDIKIQTIKALLKIGANPNIILEDGNTLLHWAAINHLNDVILALGQAEADPNQLNDVGKSPAFYAFPSALYDITNKDENTIQALMNIGADMGLRDPNGNTPFEAYVNSVKAYKMDYAQAQFEEKQRLAEIERQRRMAEIRARQEEERRQLAYEREARAREAKRREDHANMMAVLNGFRQGVNQAVSNYQRDQARQARQHEENMNWARELDEANARAEQNRRQAQLDYQREQEQLAREMREIQNRLWQQHSDNGGSYDFSGSSSSQSSSNRSTRQQNKTYDTTSSKRCDAAAEQKKVDAKRDDAIKSLNAQFNISETDDNWWKHLSVPERLRRKELLDEIIQQWHKDFNAICGYTAKGGSVTIE